jgi:1-acyl-sn-glycerol-3-phosphate acyltransferase
VNIVRRVRRALQTSRRAPGWPAINRLIWWNGVRGLIRVFFKFAYRLRIEGEQHVPDTGPIIYVSNHQSHFDPCTVGVLVGDRPFSGMARSTLFRNPILGWIMRSIGVISLDQSKGDAGAFKAALAELQAGRCVLIFPEGTRTRDGAIHEFKPGVALLIRRSGAPVLPVATEGAFDIWPIGTKRPKLTGRMAVRAAPPIAAKELMQDGPEAALLRLRHIIDDLRLDLRARMRRESGGRYPAPGPGDLPVDRLGC